MRIKSDNFAMSMFDQPAVTLPSLHRTETATASISLIFSNPLWKISAGVVP